MGYTIGDMVGAFKEADQKFRPIHSVHKTGVYPFKKKYENTDVIAVESSWVVPFTDTDKQDHTPFNRLKVFNNSGNDIEIRFSRSSTENLEILKDGDIMIWDKDDKLNYSYLEIYNRSSLAQIELKEIISIVETVV